MNFSADRELRFLMTEMTKLTEMTKSTEMTKLSKLTERTKLTELTERTEMAIMTVTTEMSATNNNLFNSRTAERHARGQKSTKAKNEKFDKN